MTLIADGQYKLVYNNNNNADGSNNNNNNSLFVRNM
jgi:hypothetical protein